MNRTIMWASGSNRAAGIARLWHCRRGVAIVEFAYVLPVLLLIALGGVEVSRYVLLNQKLDKAAVATSDLVAQATTLTESDLSMIFLATPYVMQPFDAATNGRIVVSAVTYSTANGARVAWQRTNPGTLSVTSQIGNEGGYATLPTGFTMSNGEVAIFAEAFYTYQPVLVPATIAARSLYARSIHRPRLGALDTISP